MPVGCRSVDILASMFDQVSICRGVLVLGTFEASFRIDSEVGSLMCT